MWRLHVLAAHLRWYGLYESGLAMLDGSYYRESLHDDMDFLPHGDPAVDFGGG